MKPTEGRGRVVIDEVFPQIDCGRHPAKSTLGDLVEVTAAIFGDGHDHVAARLLYRPTASKTWKNVPFTALPNDLWTASFPVDQLGSWEFTIEAWVDHFDTWVSELVKRLAAQNPPADSREPTQQLVNPQDIPLALRIGAQHLEATAGRAKGSDATTLTAAATRLRSLADANHPFYDSPVDDGLVALAARYPDLSFATRLGKALPLWVDRERARFSAWYELFPRSCSPTPGQHGTLRDVGTRLPEIAAMGFDIVYMPPIHPIGVQFRKGRNNSVAAEPGDVGSPWAIGAAEGGHTAILPELGTLADFDFLVAEASKNGLELALDIAFQCSPDHPWVTAHPDWFTIRPDGTIQYAENPPKKYQDIYPLNFESGDWRGLWDALHGVFAFWIDHGVKVFRVDNPHTKALPFWEWCIAEIHRKSPDVLFLAEAFTRPHVMYALAKGGYTQGYTYFTWRTDGPGLQAYFEEICNPPVRDFFRPNVWPNTPDILHEQLQVSDPAARRSIFMSRLILAATLSANYGIYGPAYELCEGRAARPAPRKKGSEEYLDSEKYQLRAWDRTDPISIAPLITQLNEIRRAHPCLQRNENLVFHGASLDGVPRPEILCYSKSSSAFLPKSSATQTLGESAPAADPADAQADTILVVVNLDNTAAQAGWLQLRLDKLGVPWNSTFEVEDLLTGARYTWKEWSHVALQPEQPAHIFRVLG